MFDFAETTKDMTAVEILNYYRNLYYADPQVTERGIMANAINDYFKQTANKSGWISVAERLPEDDLPKDTERRTIRCLVATNKGSVKACVRQRYISPSNGKLTPWCWSRDMFATPTHWMPLPEPPKGV